MEVGDNPEDMSKPAGLKRYFGPGPRLPESTTLFGFSTMEIVNRFNIILAVLSCLSMLLGLFTYVYGIALAMIAPVLCHVWLHLCIVKFRQPLHYATFMIVYTADCWTLLAFQLSSLGTITIVLIAEVALIPYSSRTLAGFAGGRGTVLVAWYSLQLTIALLGVILFFFVLHAYMLMKDVHMAHANST